MENRTWKREILLYYKDHEPYVYVQVNNTIFTEAIIFHGFLVIGDYDCGIYFISLEDLSIKHIEIEWYFGYFVVNQDVLYVLGAKNILAYDHDLQLLWTSEHLAIDGIVFHSVSDDTMTVECEMDPPGGWMKKTISLKDGKHIPY